MELLDAILYLLSSSLPLFVGFLFRKRLFKAFGRAILTGVWTYGFEEVSAVDESGTKVRKLALKPEAVRILGVVTPAFVQQAVKAIQIKTPKNLPINPVTGQFDLMGPVLQKIASGRKVGFEDFLPMVMEKAMPFVEQLLGGMSGKKPADKEAVNPYLKELAP